jgi:hypothetical protein
MYFMVPRWRSQRVGNSWSRSSTHSAVSLASASWSQQSSTVSRTSLTAVQSRHNSGNKGRALWRDTRTCICSNVGWWPGIAQVHNYLHIHCYISSAPSQIKFAYQLLPQKAACMEVSLHHSGTGLNTVMPAPREPAPRHTHQSVSVMIHNPWDSLPLLTLQVPCSAACPPETASSNFIYGYKHKLNNFCRILMMVY